MHFTDWLSVAFVVSSRRHVFAYWPWPSKACVLMHVIPVFLYIIYRVWWRYTVIILKINSIITPRFCRLRTRDRAWPLTLTSDLLILVHVPTSTRNISSKFMHAFLSNPANRQTDRQTRAKTCTSSFVGGKLQLYNCLLCIVETCAGVRWKRVPRSIERGATVTARTPCRDSEPWQLVLGHRDSDSSSRSSDQLRPQQRRSVMPRARLTDWQRRSVCLDLLSLLTYQLLDRWFAVSLRIGSKIFQRHGHCHLTSCPWTPSGGLQPPNFNSWHCHCSLHYITFFNVAK